MSLQYIIDGYNLINHPLFAKNHKKRVGIQIALLEFIRGKRLTGSLKNRVIVVFDGYFEFPGQQDNPYGIRVIFSQEETADEQIKKLVEASVQPRNIVVVSDDKEVRFTAKALGASALGIEEFMEAKKTAAQQKKPDMLKPELNYTQIAKINQELKKRWLK
jgi:predicted RNA-binding protein with PIN domain